MYRKTLILLSIVLFSVQLMFAQTTKKLDLSLRNASLKEFLLAVEKQTDYTFMYSNIDLKEVSKINITVHQQTVDEVLKQVLPSRNITYEISGSQIILKEIKKEKQQRSQESPTVTIAGNVKDTYGEPLIGVSVILQDSESAIGTVTDPDGNFTIKITNDKSRLKFSYVGYIDQIITVGKQRTLSVVMAENSELLDEVVVVGYGTAKKASLTSAISNMKGAEVAQKPVPNFTNSLGGRLSGIISRQGGAEPGFDGAEISIRGRGTTGKTDILVVIDGVPRNNYSQIDPMAIESVTVLKDAAAVAPYGLGGANGVLLITTKKGSTGAPKLSYNGYIGFQNPTRITPMVNSYQFALLQNEAARNSGLSTLPFDDNALTNYKKTVDGVADSDPNRYPNSRGIKDILKDNAILTYHNIELTGGADRFKYYISLAYTSQDSQFATTNLKRYNAQTRFDVQATETTDIVLALSGYAVDAMYPGKSAGDIMYAANRMPANQAIRYTNGLAGSYLGRSPIGYIYNSGYDKNEQTQLYTTLSVEQKLPFLKGLSIKGLMSYDPYTRYKKRWTTPVLSYTPDFSQDPVAYEEVNEGEYALRQEHEEKKIFTFQGYINYQNTFGLHNINMLAVAERIQGKNRGDNLWRSNYPIDIDEIDQGGTAPGQLGNGGSSDNTAQVGFVYRLGYGYAGKYLAEVAGRYDGNYYFAPGKKWAFFPSVSFGWNIAEESFIKDKIPYLEQLKLRASYGESGNLAGSAYQYLSGYNLNSPSAYFGNATTGVNERNQANSFITWEKAQKFNVGMDVLLSKGLLSFSLDYFYENRANMLIGSTVTVPLEYGISLPDVNGGEMSNQGIEFSINSTHTFPNKLRLDLAGTFTYARNKMKQMFETNSTYNNPNRRKTGRSFDTQFGYQTTGYFTANDFGSDGKLIPGIASIPDASVAPGDIRYKDLSGPDGVPDGIIDANDETVIARSKNTPQIIYGFSPTVAWKNFDLNGLLQGAAKYNIMIEGNMRSPFNNQGTATRLMFDDHWTADNTDALYPRVTSQPLNHNTVSSSHWVRNAAYVRIKSIEFGYTIPAKITKKAAISRLRVYMSGQNLWTWTPFMDEKIDPEAGNTDGLYYFQQTAVAFGINLTF